jgi:hypothetical protein
LFPEVTTKAQEPIDTNFVLTRKIIDAWYPPETFIMCITYAPLGYGKSSYDFKVCAETLRRIYHVPTDFEAWEKLKEFIVFHPSQFFQKIDEIEACGLKRVPFIVWEDMGLWLYALSHHDPFIEAFIKYLNVARTHLASLVGSTPSPEWVLRKLRRFPACYTIRISKTNSCEPSQSWQRVATGYSFWLHADLKHSGVRKIFEDSFSCKMPEHFFNWYKPLRDEYENVALALVKEKWQQISKESKSLLLASYPAIYNLPSLKRFNEG